jgi:hypothetical protein
VGRAFAHGFLIAMGADFLTADGRRLTPMHADKSAEKSYRPFELSSSSSSIRCIACFCFYRRLSAFIGG